MFFWLQRSAHFLLNSGQHLLALLNSAQSPHSTFNLLLFPEHCPELEPVMALVLGYIWTAHTSLSFPKKICVGATYTVLETSCPVLQAHAPATSYYVFSTVTAPACLPACFPLLSPGHIPQESLHIEETKQCKLWLTLILSHSLLMMIF